MAGWACWNTVRGTNSSGSQGARPLPRPTHANRDHITSGISARACVRVGALLDRSGLAPGQNALAGRRGRRLRRADADQGSGPMRLKPTRRVLVEAWKLSRGGSHRETDSDPTTASAHRETKRGGKSKKIRTHHSRGSRTMRVAPVAGAKSWRQGDGGVPDTGQPCAAGSKPAPRQRSTSSTADAEGLLRSYDRGDQAARARGRRRTSRAARVHFAR